MRCTLTRRNGLWVAVYRSGDDARAYAMASRQDVARALYRVSGVWLGLGSAPRKEASHA